jgi:hypothetical protein
MIKAGFSQVNRPGNILHRGCMEAFFSDDLGCG